MSAGDLSRPPSPDVREVAADVLRRSEALMLDEVEVVVTRHRQIEVTIEKNEIHMARIQEEPAVGVRVIQGKALGFASANSFEPQALREALDAAAALARACPEDPWNGLPDPAPLPSVGAIYDDAVADLDAAAALERARRLVVSAMDVDPRVRVDGGSFGTEVVERAVRSTRGIFTHERETLAEANLMCLAVDGSVVSGFDAWGDCSRRLDGIDLETIGRHVASRVIENLRARPGRSFQGVAVLAPRAVRQLLLEPLLAGVNADNVQRGLSVLGESLDRSIAAPALRIADDGTLPGEIGSGAFDREGMPRRSTAILEEGRLAGFLHNAYTARRAATGSTGHAAGGARSIPSVGATNLVVAEGTTPLAELIRGVKLGVLVTRFSGHPKLMTGEFSGAIKGGFLIENGEISHPIRETMISGNTFALLPKVLAISRERERFFSLTTPTILVDGVSISARAR